MRIVIQNLSKWGRQIARELDSRGDKNGELSRPEIEDGLKRSANEELGRDGCSYSQTMEQLEALFRKPAPTATPEAAEPKTGRSSSDASSDLSRLSEVQLAALQTVRTKAEAYSQEAHPELLERVKALGFSEADLTTTLEYIRQKAPLNINFLPDKPLVHALEGTGTPGQIIDGFLDDDRYRNQFDIGYFAGSGGKADTDMGARSYSEKDLFGGAYDSENPEDPKGLFDWQRPIYAGMNVFALPEGPAARYGDCYLELKSGVRDRSTFTYRDSLYGKASWEGTAEHFEHVLNKKSDAALRRIFEVALGQPISEPDKIYDRAGKAYSSSADPTYSDYVEAQVHGPLEFASDVEAIWLNKRLQGSPCAARVQIFAERYGLPVKWTEEAPKGSVSRTPAA